MFFRYKVFSRSGIQRPQSDDEEFDDTSNVTVQDMEQIELTTQSSTQTTSRTYAVVGQRTTSTTTLATPTTSTILTDITNESQTTLSFNDNSYTRTTTTIPLKSTPQNIQNIPSLREISLSQDFDHSTHKPIVLSTLESGLDTQEVTATTTQYNSIDDSNNNNNISNGNQNTDTEEVTVHKTDVDTSSVDLQIDNNYNIKKQIDYIDISSNSSPLKNNVDSSSSTTTTTSIPKSITNDRNNGDSLKKHFNTTSDIFKSTTPITSTETSSQLPTNNEFLGTVSSPRPFGFPRRRTRPTITTTANPDHSAPISLNSEQNLLSSLDKINRSNDNKKLVTKKVSSSFRINTENSIVSESSSTPAPKVIDGSINKSSVRNYISDGNGIGQMSKTNHIQEFSPKNIIGMSRVYVDYERTDSEEEDNNNQLLKQYNWKDSRIPRIKWKQVPLESSDVSTYKAYKYILNEDNRIIRVNQFDNILDDKDETKRIRKRSAESTTKESVKNHSWKDGRNSKIKWKQTSLDSIDISNLKSYRHYLSEDREYQRKHVEQQKQDQDSLKRLSRSIHIDKELPTHETINRRKLTSFDENNANINSEDANLVQFINEMIEETDIETNDSSLEEEEDLRPLTSFKKSPYQFKYNYNSVDQKKHDEHATIKYKYSGKFNNSYESKTNEKPSFKLTFNSSRQNPNDFSKQNTKAANSVPSIRKHNFSSHLSGQQSSTNTEPVNTVSSVTQPEKEFPISQANISKNITTPVLTLDEQSTTKNSDILENTTKANRKYKFSFKSNQTASRGSYSYEETENRTQLLTKSENLMQNSSNALVENEITPEEHTIIISHTADLATDINLNLSDFSSTTSATTTSIENDEISTSTENFKATTFKGYSNDKFRSTTPRNRQFDKMLAEYSIKNSTDQTTNERQSYKFQSTSKLDQSFKKNIAASKRRPITSKPLLKVDEDVPDRSKISSIENFEAPSWKSKSRGTFRPKIQDFSSLLSLDNNRQKPIPIEYSDKASRRQKPMKEFDDEYNPNVVDRKISMREQLPLTRPQHQRNSSKINPHLATVSTEKPFRTITEKEQEFTRSQPQRNPSKLNPHLGTTSTEGSFRTTVGGATTSTERPFRSNPEVEQELTRPELKINHFKTNQYLATSTERSFRTTIEGDQDFTRPQPKRNPSKSPHLATTSTERSFRTTTEAEIHMENSTREPIKNTHLRVFGSSSDLKESNATVSEIPLFTRRKYYKYLKDSPTIYVSKSENNVDRNSDSVNLIKEVFDTSFDLTTPISNVNKIRTSKMSSKNVGFFIEPEEKSEQKSSFSSKVRISLLPSDNLATEISLKPSFRKSKSAKISSDNQLPEMKRRATNEEFSDLEDMVTERSSYYDIPENIDFTTISNENEGLVSANEVNGLIDLFIENSDSDVSETENPLIEMKNMLSEEALIKAISVEPEIIETNEELKKQGILRYKNMNNLDKIRSTSFTTITNKETVNLNSHAHEGAKLTTTEKSETTPYISIEAQEKPSFTSTERSLFSQLTEEATETSAGVNYIGFKASSKNIKNEEADSVTELFEPVQSQTAERSQTASSNIPLTGSTTEISRTRFPVRNRPTIIPRATTDPLQVEVTSTNSLDTQNVEPKKGRLPLNRRKPYFEREHASITKSKHYISTTDSNEIIFESKDSSTEKFVQPSRRPGLRNKIQSTPKAKTAVGSKNQRTEPEIETTTVKSQPFSFRNRQKINTYEVTSRTSSTASPNENNAAEESTTANTRKLLVSRNRPAFTYRFKTSSTEPTSEISLSDDKSETKEDNNVFQELLTSTRRSTIRLNRLRSTTTSTRPTTEGIAFENSINKGDENNFFKEPLASTRRSVIRSGLNRLRKTSTSTTESAGDAINETPAETNENPISSTQRNLIFRKRPAANILKTTSSPQIESNVFNGDDNIDPNFSVKQISNQSLFKKSRRPLLVFKSTTTPLPYSEEDESKELEDSSVEEDSISNVKSSLPFNKIQESKTASDDTQSDENDSSEEDDIGQKNIRYKNIINGSNTNTDTNDEILESSTRKYVQITRSKISHRSPGSPFANSDTENEIESAKDSSDNELSQQPIRKYTPINRVRSSAEPTDAPIVLAENGYPLGYKPIGRSKAKQIITNNNEEALDINDTLNTSTNIDIAHSDTSLELNDNYNSNTSYLNKNSNQRFQNKFTRTRNSGSTINKTTNPTPIQVNYELESENTSTPSSSHRFRAIKRRRPINNTTPINELNNDTSTSTTITQSEDNEQNSNTLISESVDKIVEHIEEVDADVHETLRVSELKRPSENTTLGKSVVDEDKQTYDEGENIDFSMDSFSSAKTVEDLARPDANFLKLQEAVEGFKLETTSEKIPESETAESNDESHTEISELPSTNQTFIAKNTSTKKNSNKKINKDNHEENLLAVSTERQIRPFFPKRFTTVKPILDESGLESIATSESPSVELPTSRVRRPLVGKKSLVTNSPRLSEGTSPESSEELNVTKSEGITNRTRRPFFSVKKATTQAPIDDQLSEEDEITKEITENEQPELEPVISRFRKPVIGIRRTPTTNLKRVASNEEESFLETAEVSTRRSFFAAKKLTSTTQGSVEDDSTKSTELEKVPTRKSFRSPALSIKGSTESSEKKELHEDQEKTSTSTQKSRFALGGRRNFITAKPTVNSPQSSTTLEDNTSREPRVFERKFIRTRTTPNSAINTGLNNAGVGFIDLKTLSLATRGRSAAINRFKSTTLKPNDEDISEEVEDEDEESNEVINHRSTVKPSGFIRPTIKGNLFSNRNQLTIRRPIQRVPKNEQESESEENDSVEEEEDRGDQRPVSQKPVSFPRPSTRPNAFSLRNVGKITTSRRPQTLGSEEQNTSEEKQEEDDNETSRLSNFNSKIYEKVNLPSTLPTVTKSTRRTANNPYGAISRLRANVNHTTPFIRKAPNRPRVANRPQFGSSTQSSVDQEISTQNTNSNTRAFKRKFGKFTTTTPSTQTATKADISVDALNIRNKQINELTSLKPSITTAKPTQSKTSATTETKNTEPTEDYDSTTIIATTIPDDGTEDHTEMDETIIPFQNDSLLKLDSTVDTTTKSNEEETTLTDETLTQLQEIISPMMKGPVTTSTEKATTLQHVFAIPFDERAEITTEFIESSSTDSNTISKKTQEIEDEVKKIINMLTASDIIKPVYEEVIKETLVKDSDGVNPTEKNEEAEEQGVLFAENNKENANIVTEQEKDEQIVLLKENQNEEIDEKLMKDSEKVVEDNNEEHVIEKTSVVSDDEAFKYKESQTSHDEVEGLAASTPVITEASKQLVSEKAQTRFENKNNNETLYQETDLVSNDKLLEIDTETKSKSEDTISTENAINSSTESNLIKIVTGQTIIFFDDYDEDNQYKDSQAVNQQEKPIVKANTTTEDFRADGESKSPLGSNNKIFNGKKFFHRSQDSKSTLDTKIRSESEVAKTPQEKFKSVLEERRSFALKNKFLAKEKGLGRYDETTQRSISDLHISEDNNVDVNQNENVFNEGKEAVTKNPPTTSIKQKIMLNNMIKDIKEVEMRSQEKIDYDNISDEEKKRLTAEKLVEINKIVEVYLKEEKVRFNPETMEIIRLGDGELKLVRPARTFKLGEISRIKHVSNVQIEGHSSVSGTTFSPSSYKQARNVRVAFSDPIRNALPSDNTRHGKVFVVPEIVKHMETSTISLEGLYYLNRHGKDLNTVYEPESEVQATTTTEKNSIPLQYVRPVTLESDPLVISIANLDQVVLSKLQKDRQ